MNIDLRSAFLLGAILIVAQSLVLALVLRDLPSDTHRAARDWYSGSLVQAFAYLLFSQRGELHAFFSIVLPNALFIAGFSGYWRSIRRFDGRSDRILLLAPALIDGILIFYFTFIDDWSAARFVTSSIIAAVVLGLCAITLLRARAIQPSASRHMLLAVTCLGVSYFTWRTAYFLLPSDRPPELLSPGLVPSLDAAFAMLLPITGTTAFLVLCTDRVRRHLDRLASTDHLTGLLSRRSIETAAEIALDGSRGNFKAFSLLVVDIDHFKRFNDSYGHAAGDTVIRLVAAVLKECTRGGDLVGRWGGEEFVVLSFGESPEAALMLAERVRSKVESVPLRFGDGRERAQVSIGVTIRYSADADFKEIFSRADTALFNAKRLGRNRVECLKI